MAFFDELKRRNVFRVGIAYVVVGWGLAQVAEFAFLNFGAPAWALKAFVVVLILGLPIILIAAWAFEITPEGIRREKDVDRSQSITPSTGRRLDRIIIAVLGVAVAMLLVKEFYIDKDGAAENKVTATAGRQSIAVLPFTNMSEDNDNFSDGLSEELLNLLAQTPELKVAGRTSSFVFKGRNEDLRVIGDSLGVDHVLEGSVRRSGDRLRITAQLIKVDDGFHVWSETYNRQMADIFDIQDDVAGAISKALKIRLAPQADRLTDNPDAYSRYLQAVAMASDINDGVIDPIIALLDDALAIDPGFAKAHELKAMAYWIAGGWTIDSPVAQTLAYESAIAALKLDPSLVNARAFSVTANPQNWSWLAEIEAFEAAYIESPNDLRLLDSMAYEYLATGYFRDSLEICDRLIELDPLSSSAYLRRAQTLRALGRRAEARKNLQHAFELGAALAGSILASDYIVAGEYELAADWLERSESLFFSGREEIDAFFGNVLKPDTGRQYLVDWVDSKSRNAADFEIRHTAYFWLTYFAYLDELWERIDDLDMATDALWDNTDTLISSGFVHRRKEMMAHPRFLPFRMSDTSVELWEARGAPDFCRKDSGEWVCE